MKRIHAPTILLSALLLCLASSGAALAQPTLVSYQGELSVNGSQFNGNADFKFVILCGTASAWSNDGTSTSGSEPAGSVALDVQQGVFSVLLGDPALSMVALTADLINSCTSPKLRVWVDTGAGFEQLSDQALASSPFALKADAARRGIGGFSVSGTLKISGSSGSTTIYADGQSGQVGLSEIKFADGTVQTTAAGAGGADSDWSVNGSNMNSIPTGNVGIGTASPDRKLHIQGGSDITTGFAGGFLRIGDPSAASFSMLVDQNEIQTINAGGAGDLGINALGGEVGIGTVSPSTALHVIGEVRAQGVGVDGNGGHSSTNPNNAGALVRLDWLNDVARIRVGGSGTGAANGFDIQTTSDRSLMRLLHNGNVGIGTTTPAALLDVAGDAQIQGNLTIQGGLNVGGVSVGGGVLSIPPNALNPTDSPMAFHRSQLLLNGTTAGQGLTFEAPVYLPQGATITEYSAILTDNNGVLATGSNIQTFLMAKPLSTVVGTIIANQSTTGAPGRVTLTQTGLSHVVDNQNNTYSIACNWVTPTTVTQMQVHGFRIVYTAGP